MEQILNQLPQDNPRHISWRGIALAIIVVGVVVGFLIYSGGFNALARIFGSKAGTESQLVLAGLDNLSNAKTSSDWLVKDATVTLSGTGIFSDFSQTPSFIVPGSLDAAFVMPLVASPDSEAFVEHRYTSAPINIGQTGVILNSISVYAYLPESTNPTFSYRTSDDLAELDKSELHELVSTFSTLSEADKISRAVISLNRDMKQYLQLTVEFEQFSVDNRPAVYGWIVDYGQSDVTVPSATKSDKTKLTLTYSGGPNIPATAHLELLGSELALNPMYGQDVNLQLAGSEYVVDALPLPAGAYTIRVTGSTIREKLVPFMVEEGDTELTVRLEAFEAGLSSGVDLINPDLNRDGKINALDAQLLFEQYGEKP